MATDIQINTLCRPVVCFVVSEDVKHHVYLLTVCSVQSYTHTVLYLRVPCVVCERACVCLCMHVCVGVFDK